MVLKDNLHTEFRTYYLHSSIPSMRLGLAITLIIFILFTIISRLFFAEDPGQYFLIKLAAFIPILILSILVTYIKPLTKRINLCFIVLNSLVCVLIFIIGASTPVSSPGYEYYFTWVMLVVVGLFTFYRLRFRTLVIIGALQVLTYFFTTLFNGTLTEKPSTFLNNLFFVLSMYSVGFFMAYIIEHINWKNFIQTRALSANYKKLLQESKDREIAESALHSSEILYRDTLNAIPDWIYVVDEHLRFVMLNSSLQEEHYRQGFTENCIGRKINRVYPFISKKTLEEIEQVFQTGKILIGEQKLEFLERTIFGETRKVPILKDGKVVQVITIMRDRSKEKEVEELKAKNIGQKEIMLREIHHRVKNNLAIVISLLNLQMQNNEDPELHRIMRDIEMRIRSMALIHEHLYRSENLDRIPLSTYLHSLSSIILSTFSGHRISVIEDLDQMDISIETALPIGLIANELLTNAFKYAFPDNRKGNIKISLKKQPEDHFSLILSDDGIGLPPDFSFETNKSLGMFIVKLLVEQLDGKIEINQHKGTSFSMYFPNPVSHT